MRQRFVNEWEGRIKNLAFLCDNLEGSIWHKTAFHTTAKIKVPFNEDQ